MTFIDKGLCKLLEGSGIKLKNQRQQLNQIQRGHHWSKRGPYLFQLSPRYYDENLKKFVPPVTTHQSSGFTTMPYMAKEFLSPLMKGVPKVTVAAEETSLHHTVWMI